jgi:hypothetical protein
MVEGLAVPLPLNALPRGPERIYAWLASQPPTVVVEWPLPKPNSLGITREPDYMYFSTSHWQPLVNGYSGRYPDSYIEFLHAVARFPDDRAISFLRRRRVRYVLLRRDADPIAYDAAVDDIIGNQEDLKTDGCQRGSECEKKYFNQCAQENIFF